MKKKFILVIIASFLGYGFYSQIPTIQWQKCIGGVALEYSGKCKPTIDGGFIICGSSKSNDGDAITNNGWNTYDFLVVKLNNLGIIEWSKCFGGSNDDLANDIIQTTDGGYIVVGDTYSSNGMVSGSHGGNDVWVVKLSSDGNVVWSNCYGGTGADFGNNVEILPDGNFLISGYTTSNDGNVSGNHGGINPKDAWCFKINNSGLLLWQKCFGGSGVDVFWSFFIQSNGDILFTGETNSNDGDVSGNHGGITDVWVVKTNSNCSLIWQKCFGGSSQDRAWDAILSNDGNYTMIGETKSNDGDVSGNHGGNNPYDIWLLKISSFGNLISQKCLGGTGADYGRSLVQKLNGNFILAGSTSSNNGDVTNLDGNGDAWLIELSNANNSIIWQKTFGGSSYDNFNAICLTSNFSLFLQGSTSSNNGDVSGNHGGSAIGDADIWIAKMCNGSPSNGVDSQTSCGPYTWIDGVTYTTSNYSATYTIPSSSINGCDSIVTLNLNLIQDSILISDSSYNTYTYNGQIFYNSGVYLVDTLFNPNGCMTFVYLDLIIYNSGMNEKGTMGIISISPNPTSDKISIKINDDFIKQQFFLYDKFGRIILASRFEAIESEVDLSEFQTGIYFLRVEGSNETIKIVKN